MSKCIIIAVTYFQSLIIYFSVNKIVKAYIFITQREYKTVRESSKDFNDNVPARELTGLLWKSSIISARFFWSSDCMKWYLVSYIEINTLFHFSNDIWFRLVFLNYRPLSKMGNKSSHSKILVNNFTILVFARFFRPQLIKLFLDLSKNPGKSSCKILGLTVSSSFGEAIIRRWGYNKNSSKNYLWFHGMGKGGTRILDEIIKCLV